MAIAKDRTRAAAGTRPPARAGRADALLSRFRRKPPAPKPAPAPEPKPAPPAPKPRRRAGPPARSPVAVLLRALIMLVAFLAMVAFAVALARLTLTPSPASEGIAHSNLQPGASLRLYLRQPSVRDAVKQIGGNLALGVPFGVLLPVVWPKVRGLLRVVLTTAAVMLLVELVQGAMVPGRSFDIDDVILNTAGALVGYLLLGRPISRAVHPPRRRWWHRRAPAERSAVRAERAD